MRVKDEEEVVRRHVDGLIERQTVRCSASSDSIKAPQPPMGVTTAQCLVERGIVLLEWRRKPTERAVEIKRRSVRKDAALRLPSSPRSMPRR